MKVNNYFKFFTSLAISFGVSLIGSAFTTPSIPNWYAKLSKPALNPPSWVFGFVWTILFFLIALSLFIVWKNNFKIKNNVGNYRKAWNRFSEKLWQGKWQKLNIISIFAIQYILNIFWSFVFFGLHLPGLAFFCLIALWIAILYTIINTYRVSKIASYLLIPYILWVSFAGYLNFAIWILN